MEVIDLDLIKFLSTRENYETYHDVVTKNMCTKEAWMLVGDFGRYYKEFPEIQTIDSQFDMWFRVTGHPGWKPDEQAIYGNIVRNALTRESPVGKVFLAQLDRTRQIEDMSKWTDQLRKGTLGIDALQSKLATLTTGQSVREDSIQLLSLDGIAKHQRDNQGLYWRCEDLNKSIGPIRKGDFVIVGKRPEVGGTSFLTSEMSFMMEQFDSNAILFNNEEAPAKVYTRMVSSSLGVDYKTMMTAHAYHEQEYRKWLAGNEWDLCHDGQMTLHSIERLLKEKEYGLIGINVLLKVGGTDQKEDHDKFQALGESCRRLAADYAPIIAIVQADPSAEGMQYIPQDRIYKSKTALQGEADAMIMIGKDHDLPDDIRFISVCKNKLPPAPCTDIAQKHIKSQVSFDVGTGRFTTVNFQGHSKP